MRGNILGCYAPHVFCNTMPKHPFACNRHRGEEEEAKSVGIVAFLPVRGNTVGGCIFWHVCFAGFATDMAGGSRFLRRMRNTFCFSTLKAPFAIWKNLYSWSSRSNKTKQKIFWHFLVAFCVFYPTWLGNFEGSSILLTPLHIWAMETKTRGIIERGRGACQKTLSPLPHTPVLSLLFAARRRLRKVVLLQWHFIFFLGQSK